MHLLTSCAVMLLCVVCSRAIHSCTVSTCSTSMGAFFLWRSTCCTASSSCFTSNIGALFPSVSYSLMLLAPHASAIPRLISKCYYLICPCGVVYMHMPTHSVSGWLVSLYCIFCIKLMTLLSKLVYVLVSK